jgi:hypothetical protein
MNLGYHRMHAPVSGAELFLDLGTLVIIVIVVIIVDFIVAIIIGPYGPPVTPRVLTVFVFPFFKPP